MVFTSGISVPEGPVLLDDNSWLVVEMGPDRGCVTHISRDGKKKTMIAKTGRPNGLAVDRAGVIWVAESQSPSLLKLTMDGKVEVFLTECNGEPFLFPNDLVFGPDGYLYMTDSGILFEDLAPGGKIKQNYLELDVDGRVYRIDTRTKDIEKIDAGIKFTNGLAFGPDGNLYVNETFTGAVYHYPSSGGKVSGGRQLFGNVIDPQAPEGFKGPDGMKFGENGNLYVTVFGQGDVTVLDRNGSSVVDRIRTEGKLPTNCAFGPRGSKQLYVTEDEKGTLEVLDVGTDGFQLYRGNA